MPLPRLTACAALFALAGCASMAPAPLPEGAPADVRQCAALFQRVDEAVVDRGVRDDEAHVLAGYPWYRSSRFLASYRREARGEALGQWLGLMAGLDARGRRHELANLPPESASRFEAGIGSRLDACRERLMAFDHDRPGRIEAIRESAKVPDAYIEWRRVLGIYPVTGWLILQGVKDYHDEEIERFATPPTLGATRRYAPDEKRKPDPEWVGPLLERSAANPLDVPLPGPREARRLFQAFAPVVVIETRGDHDRPGVPVWTEQGVSVRPEPVVYVRISHARYQGEALLQLNYLVWFSKRPRTGPFDMLGGRLDGVYWRVTLGRDGKPLLYDSMHACGCYHMAFPTPRLEARPPRGGLNEPLLVPRPAPAGEGRMTLFLESGSHYLVGIGRGAEGGEAERYSLADYHELRSLPAGQSLFGEHGIVPGTDRREEFFLWPTGVRAPGAQRQWGTHATAFVGRRHFDDPFLIERYFRPVKAGEAR